MSLYTLENNWDNFSSNINFFEKLANNQEIMPIIKANAYGHGLKKAVEIIENKKIKKIGVGEISEAYSVLKHGFTGEVISLLGLFHKSDLELYSHNPQILPLIHNFETLDFALQHSSPQKLKFALKINTGMNRLGFANSDLAEVMNILSKQNKLEPTILLSHFSSADVLTEQAYTDMQLATFSEAYNFIKNYYPKIKTSFGNTAKTLADPAHAGDIMRPGVGLYGGNPFDATSLEAKGKDLKQVMSVYTKILEVRQVPKNTSIGYARSYICPKDTKMAVIGIGYADGYMRALSKGGRATYKNQAAQVLINGQFAPVIANVAMQMMFVDVTNIDCKYDDRAYILGGPRGSDKFIDLHALATWCGTITYELTCALGQKCETCEC